MGFSIDKLSDEGIVIGKAELSIVVIKDDNQYSAYCPELDLAIAADTPNESIEEMIEEIKEYAKEYKESYVLYSKSPNRSAHVPLIKKVIACKSEWELMKIIEVRYADHIRSV